MVKWNILRYTRTLWFSLTNKKKKKNCGLRFLLCVCLLVYSYFVLIFVSKLSRCWIFPVECCLEPLGQFCTRFLPMLCCPKSIKTFIRIFLMCNVWSLLDNIAQGFYLFSVRPWLTDNVYEESNLCNVVLTILWQHWIGILSSQCCLNTSKTTLRKKHYLCNVDQVHRHVFEGK